MSKIDYSVLDNYTEADVKRFNKEVEGILNGTTTALASADAVAYFYLTLHKMEEEKRRGLTLEETHRVIRGLQGQILTLMEASLEGEKLKAVKAIVNNHFSQAQSLAQDYDWGMEDNHTDTTCPDCFARGVVGCSC